MNRWVEEKAVNRYAMHDIVMKNEEKGKKMKRKMKKIGKEMTKRPSHPSEAIFLSESTSNGSSMFDR